MPSRPEGAALGTLRGWLAAINRIHVEAGALTGGALTSVVVVEMITKAHEGDTSRLGSPLLTAGFAIRLRRLI